MIELIVACMASTADFSCPMVLPSNSSVEWGVRLGGPLDICLENTSDHVGSMAVVKMASDGAVIRVSPNIHICKTPVS